MLYPLSYGREPVFRGESTLDRGANGDGGVRVEGTGHGLPCKYTGKSGRCQRTETLAGAGDFGRFYDQDVQTTSCVRVRFCQRATRQFPTMAAGARGFRGIVCEPAASTGRKSLRRLALRIVELRRNSIGGDIIPPFCALDGARRAAFLERCESFVRQNGAPFCWVVSKGKGTGDGIQGTGKKLRARICMRSPTLADGYELTADGYFPSCQRAEGRGASRKV